MPGLIAVAGIDPQSASLARSLSGALRRAMYRATSMEAQEIGVHDSCTVTICHQPKDYRGSIVTREWSLAWFGLPLYGGQPLTTIAGQQLQNEPGNVDIDTLIGKFGGHFQMVAFHRASCEFYAIMDKISTHPLYYTELGGLLIVAAEPLVFRTLRSHGWNAAVRREAVYEFMASGHLWSDGTFWEKATRLGPGQLLRFDGYGVEKRSYWKMTYTPSSESEDTLVSKLAGAVQTDFETLPEGNALLTLSGGFDSRALLGLLHRSKCAYSCMSYSFGEESAASSDAVVGRYFASKVGATHNFYRANIEDGTRLLRDIQSVIVATGGETDVVVSQDAFLGCDFYSRLAKDHDYIIRGDEVWGWGDHVINPEMAFWQCFLFQLNDFSQPARILNPDALAAGIKHIENSRVKLAEEYDVPGHDADALKDFLYWRHRESRLLQNMAYLRRCYIPHFAPFLLEHTTTVLRTVPSRLRIRKKLFMAMARREFPDLFTDRRAPTPYLVKGNRFEMTYQIPAFKEFIRQNLVENLPDTLRCLVQSEDFSKWIEPTLNRPATTARPRTQSYNLKRFLNDILKHNQWISAHVKSLLHRTGRLHFPVQNSNYLFRLTVLARALREYEGTP